jgi:hypothetical protein
MSPHGRLWLHLTLVSVVGVVTGYALPRPPRRGGDMLDAVAAVQRYSPRFIISEPTPGATWARTGELYLSRSHRTTEQVDGLSKHPSRVDHRWAGIACFRGTADPKVIYVPRISEKGGHRLLYGGFAVFGDPGELPEVEEILDAAGFRRAE